MSDDRTAIEERLRLFEKLVASSTDAIAIANPEGRHWYQNAAFDALFGKLGPDAIRETYCDPAVAREVLQTALEAREWRGEAKMFGADGQVLDVLVRTYPVVDDEGRIVGLVGLHTNVTHRKRSEEALRKSERRYRQLIEHENDLVVEVDSEGRFLFVSPSYCETFGKTESELLGQRFMPMVHEDDREATARAMERLPHPPHTAYMEQRAMTKQGWRWLAWSDRAIVGDDGTIESIVGVGRDITEKRETEEALNRETERLAVTLRSIGDAVITTDRDSRVVIMNPVAERLTGWREVDAVGRPLAEVFRIEHERTGEPFESPVTKVLSSGEKVALANHTTLVAKDGQRHLIADSGAPIRDRHGEIIGVVLVFRDITAQEQTKKELLKIEKLKSLGVLAGGIAHDFNNFLTGILGNLSLAKLDVEPASATSQALDEMEKAALRARDLTQQLLTFSKGGDPVRHTIAGIADLVRESVQFALRGSNVRCRFDLEDALLPADVDEGQIGQVIHNLVINADHAMPGGGTVTIRARNVELARDDPSALEPGPYIEVRIEDDGIGISPEHLRRVFDPYFTTKQRGSGLGLAVAYNIVRKHDGLLTVESELGRGTSFTMLLPASRAAPSTDAVERPALVAGRGRILVMDDEASIRKLTSTMLARSGYEVVVAEDGRAAAELYRDALEAGRRFDAVVFDLTVPGGMGGKEAIGLLTAMDPDVRAIVSSGYSNDPVMADCTSYGFRAAVQKPYRIQELTQILAAVVDGSDRG